MTNFLNGSKLLMFLLALTAISVTSCEDDDDFLGIDLSDEGTLFTSSNNSGLVGVIDTRDEDFELNTFVAAGEDADGIYYDEEDDRVYQVIRSNNSLVQYINVLDDVEDDETNVEVGARLTSAGFTSGRGLAVVDNRDFYVADNSGAGDTDSSAVDQIILYTLTGDAFDRVATYNVPFKVWGIRANDDGSRIFAVIDQTNQVAVFNNLSDQADGATVSPNRTITIPGLVRTHGLAYSQDDDLMILTDIGSAMSDSDGALFVVRDFSNFNAATEIDSTNYTRIGGAATLLGNPVDVTYDENEDRIFVAERANGGGRLLGFDLDAEGNVAPTRNVIVPGISSVWLNND